MSEELTEQQLEERWNQIDWNAAEEKLANMQRQLSLAAYRRDQERIVTLQKKIVRDIDSKCLAVRHICTSTTSPGVDGVKWRTPAEKMRAAMSLTSKDYHASPLRIILITAKNTGKERRQGIPTFYDRAMNVLYGYSLLPVTEAWADRKSFAFRPGRSTQDAHAYLVEALQGNPGPAYVVCADIKSYYANIQHDWLLQHVPMDRRVLSEFLSSGIVFAGELFPAEGTGISEGSNLSPYLGNFVLDGLQKHIFESLYGTAVPDDFSNGNMIRFADDVLVTASSMADAEKVIASLNVFLAERGLQLSEEKTRICRVTEGFTFLSRSYIRVNGLIHSEPSEQAVNRFIDELHTTIQTNRKSQRAMILQLNRKLTGWANYHRCTDAAAAFRKVDAAVQTALLESAMEKHPRMQRKKLIEKYWYTDHNGTHYYALEDDKSIRVEHLQDVLLITHKKVRTNFNPYVDREYLEERTHAREIQNVTGVYKTIWKRQNGTCFYCGRPILADQPRTTVLLHPDQRASARNSAYIHKICEADEFQIVRTMEDITLIRPYDVQHILENLASEESASSKKRPELGPDWRYAPLKRYFSGTTAASVKLTFAQIEKILGSPLPSLARQMRRWWEPNEKYNSIAEAWLTEGYSVCNMDFRNEKISFHRDEEGVSKLVIPEVFLTGKLPEDAVFEVETFLDYVIKKYGLKKREK